MRILFLDYDISKQDFYKNVLKDIASGNDLQFFSHPVALLDYIKSAVIPYQLHVDLIISDILFPSYTYSDFFDFFDTTQETYSYHNFKLSSLPIVLHSVHLSKEAIKYFNVAGIIQKPLDENNNSFASDIIDIVKQWRKKIFDDLEVLGVGLDFDFTKANMGYAVRIKSEQTNILSKSFLIKQEKLPYQWLSKDFFEMEFSIEELETLVNHYMELPRTKLKRDEWEEQLQNFFKRNPKFLFQDNYLNYWSQPKLNILNSRKSYKPDFVVQPTTSFELGKNWDVIDLKLPAQEFLQSTQFHQTFTSKFFKCLRQIKNYKGYFMEDENKTNIEKVLGFHPKYPQLTLVVGKRNLLFEQQDKIYKELNEFNLSEIYLLTYDEIIENQKRNLQTLLSSRI